MAASMTRGSAASSAPTPSFSHHRRYRPTTVTATPSTPPLAYTDPSGYIFGIGGSIKDELKRWEQDFRHEIRRPNSLLPSLLRVAGAVGSYYCGPWAAACAGAGESALSGWQGASDRQILRNSAISAAQAYGINYVDNNWALYSAGNIAGKAVIGAGVATASGQDVLGGALAGGLSAAIRPTGYGGLDFVIAVTAGGTSSELTGGKFRNGAYTAAFLQIAVEAAKYYESKTGFPADPTPGDLYYTDAKGNCCNYIPGDEGRTPGPQYDVIGFNEQLSVPGDFWADFGKQGGALSKFLRWVPGVPATSHLHDVWNNSFMMNGAEISSFRNYGSMVPAYVVSSLAIAGNFTRGWQNNSMIWLIDPR